MSGGDPPPQQTQVTKNELGPEQKAIFDLAFPKLKDYAATVPERYPGSAIAPFNEKQTQGQEMVLDSVGNQNAIINSGSNASQFWTSPNVWDPSNNPALSGAVDAVTRPITEAYTQDYLPAVRSEAIKAGGLGGSRQGVWETVGADKMIRGVGDAANKVVQDAYSTNVRAQMQALGLLPQTAQAQTIPGVTTSSVGDVRQSQEQALLNEQVGGYTYDQLAPFLQAKELVSLVTGMPGGSTVSTANNPPQPSGLMQSLGGAASGAALGSMLFPGVGTAAGAGFGAILPFLLG